MKDAVHHLKHVQRKVIQSVRKEENSSLEAINGVEYPQSFAINTRRKQRKKLPSL